MLKLQSELFDCQNFVWNFWTSFRVSGHSQLITKLTQTEPAMIKIGHTFE